MFIFILLHISEAIVDL